MILEFDIPAGEIQAEEGATVVVNISSPTHSWGQSLTVVKLLPASSPGDADLLIAEL